jgi:hypothetical protein
MINMGVDAKINQINRRIEKTQKRSLGDAFKGKFKINRPRMGGGSSSDNGYYEVDGRKFKTMRTARAYARRKHL